MPEPLGSARAILSQLIYWICSLPPWAKILPASTKQYPVTMLPRELSPYQDGLLGSQKSLPAYLYLHSNIISSGLCNSHCVFSTVPVYSIIKMFRAISLARNGLKDPSWALIHLEHILFLSSLCLPMQEKQETQVWSLSQEDTLEKKMATRSSILSWTIPWTEEPGKLQSTGWQRVGHNWACITLLMSPNVSLKHNFLSAIFRRWKKFNLSQNMVPCKHCSQNSCQKTLMLGKIEGRRTREQ